MKTILKHAYSYGKHYYSKGKIGFLTLMEQIHRPTHCGYPIPPPRMRQLTTAGHVTIAEHIKEGLQAANMLEDILKREGIEPQSLGRVLDFGCGCGRVLRHLHRAWPNAQLFGSDVDEELVGWVRKRLHGVAHFHVNNFLPPCQFGSQSFDVVYAVSVFTHMDKKAQSAWLNEFSRIIKPGGLLLLTVHPLGQDEELRHWDFRDPEGMVYRYRRREAVKRSWVRNKSEQSYYIDAKHSKHYCKSRWGQLFDFNGFYAGALREIQALVVLRNRGKPKENPICNILSES